MNQKDVFDFGFSLVDEDELKQYEKQLEEKLQEKSLETTLTADQYKQKLMELKDMIMPLLKNLSVEPTKTYLFWPNRVEKVNIMIKKINEFMDKSL